MFAQLLMAVIGYKNKNTGIHTHMLNLSYSTYCYDWSTAVTTMSMIDTTTLIKLYYVFHLNGDISNKIQ